MPDPVLDEMRVTSATSLKATNNWARIDFALMAAAIFERTVEVRRDAPCFFVTLTPKQFAVPVSRAASFDRSKVQRWAEGVLDGFSYFGIVEAAYYSNVSTEGEATVSWHAHALVWGTTEDKVDARIDAVNASHTGLMPGFVAAYSKRCATTRTAIGRIFYMLKAPLSDYRVFQEGGPELGSWLQKKRPLRPGDAARMCRVLHGTTIDELCFSSRRGNGIRALASAYAPLLSWQRSARQRRALKRVIGAGGNRA